MNSIEFPGLGLTFNVDPVAFYIGNLPIYWYGIMIAIGVMLAFFVGVQVAKKLKVNEDQLINTAFIGCLVGIIGARLYYVVFTEMAYYMQTGEHYYTSFLDVINIRDGGLAIYGGLIFGVLAAYIFTRVKKYNFMELADCAAISIPLAQALGRWGNFFNQEAWGSNTDAIWGMTGNMIRERLYLINSSDNSLVDIVDPTMPVHPCFLYESLWCLLSAGLLFYFMKKRIFKGELFITSAILYGMGRFVIEGFRMDSLMLGASIRVSQLVSAILVIAGIALLLYMKSSVKRGRFESLSLIVEENTGTGFDDFVTGPVVVRNGEIVVDTPAAKPKKKKKRPKPVTDVGTEGEVKVIDSVPSDQATTDKPDTDEKGSSVPPQSETAGDVAVENKENKDVNNPEE